VNRIVARPSILFLIASIVLLSPPPVLAALCGGGTLCSCGDLVGANHTLTCGVDPVTIDLCFGDGLTVANGTELSLGSCTIRGVGVGEGVHLEPGATVEGGKVVQFAIGVFAEQVGTVRGVRVSETSGVGVDVAGNGSVIERNVLQRNLGIGIRVGNAPPAFPSPPGNVTVRQNRIEDNAGCGLVVSGPNNLVDRNVLLRNGECGIHIRNALEGTVVRNQVKYTEAGPGFIFENADKLQVSLNISLGAGDPGDSNSHGFHVSSTSTENTFRRNVSSHNKGYGIRDESSGTKTSNTANTYVLNNCAGNALGNSLPGGLCQ
jgi:hypothetical protein